MARPGSHVSLLSSSKESFKLLLRQQLASQASVQIPLPFLVGVAVRNVILQAFSLVAAYLFIAAWRGLIGFELLRNHSAQTGELFDARFRLARKAGRKDFTAGDAPHARSGTSQCFALSGDTIVLTESWYETDSQE